LQKNFIENNKDLKGKEKEVIVTKIYNDKTWLGYDNTLKNVVIKSKIDKNNIGDFIKVKITNILPLKLEAEILNY